MLEDRFALSAIAQGDLDDADAHEAAAYVEQVLGYRPKPPVLLDADRLRDRLERVLPAGEVDAALEMQLIVRRPPATIEQSARVLLEQMRLEQDGLDSRSLEDLASSGTLVTLTASQRFAFETAVLLAARTERGKLDSMPVSLFEGLAIVASRLRVKFTTETWETLAHEPDDLLALLIGLGLDPNGSPATFQIRRAIFENVALRRHALEIARDGGRLARLEEQVRSIAAATQTAASRPRA
jgi:hypothetical protein